MRKKKDVTSEETSDRTSKNQEECSWRNSEEDKVTTNDSLKGSGVSISGFWDATNSHHVLPVFASGTAFVPSTFDTILCQSFYNTLCPIICDALVCGQENKLHIVCKCPKILLVASLRTYSELLYLVTSWYWVCTALVQLKRCHSCICLYLSPKHSTVRKDDKLYVVANLEVLKKSLNSLQLPFAAGAVEGPNLWEICRCKDSV